MYVQNKSSLVDFMHGFERAVKEYRNNELISNFKTFYYDPVLTTKLEGLELEATKIFTRKKFKEVQDEIEDAIKVNVIERSELENVVNFKMNKFCNKNYTYIVHLDRAQSKFLCDCNLFERVGIPCSHIICDMRHEHMNIFPNSLICKRWTKSAKDDYILSMSSEECDDEKMVMLRRGTMSSALNSLCDISCKHPDDFKEAMKGIYGLCEKIKRRRDENGNHKTNTNVINDPIMTKTKGAPRKSKGIPRKTKGASRKTKGVPRNTCHTKHKYQDIGEHDALHEVDKGSVAISNVGGEKKDYGSQEKKKDVDVACSMKEFINKRTLKHIENEDIGQSNENMSNIPTTLENNVHGCGLIYGIPFVKIEGQNVIWNHSLGYAPNYTLGSNGIPVQSILVPTQFPPTVNFSSSHLNALMYPRPHIFPHNTSFLGVLEQVESSAKMACKKNDPYK
ncbi:protein FAR-RED IMPAIRED RESPONSE 1-like [Vicia villosa]|uniref:protein FAR-RED IMPAIRED RESPONSE 1-like n=1 Tax=Vicia villosa TaxID=3911 RepID=UPI00273ABBBD|nr:protein FAR-RED IMPAIRED RESPONSE 1-like [Vicia villosa]